MTSQEKYDSAHTRRISLKLNTTTDSDILEWVSKQSSIQGAIKAAIRQYLKEGE